MVVKTPKQYLQDALTNNTFNIDDTDRTLRMTLDHSFSYLYRLQRNMAIYEEFFYTTRNIVEQPDYGDFFLGKRERVCANYPVSLIPTQFREKFRTSSYYGKKIKYEDINKDHQLFTRLPVITIDNKVVRSFEFVPNDDFFTVHYGFDRFFLYTKKFNKNRWEYFYVDHNISVQVINNSDFIEFTTNTGMLQRNSYDGHSYNRIQMEYLNNFGFTLKKGGGYFATLFFGDEKLGTQLLEVETDSNGDIVIGYDIDTLQRINEYTGPLTVRLYFYRYLYKYTSFRDTGYKDSKFVRTHTIDNEVLTDTILLNDRDGNLLPMPVPSENFLIFKTRDELDEVNHNYHEVSHFPNSNVTLTYPNIYNITSGIEQGDMFKVYYFYMYPYELAYDYMYAFIYRAYTYMWKGMSVEEIINAVRLGDFTLIPKGLRPPEDVVDDFDPDAPVDYIDGILTTDVYDIANYWVEIIKESEKPTDPDEDKKEPDEDDTIEPDPNYTTPYENLRMLTALYHAKRMVAAGLIPKLALNDAYYYLYERITSNMESIEDIKIEYIISIGRDPNVKPESEFLDFVLTADINDVANYWIESLGVVSYPLGSGGETGTGTYKPPVKMTEIPKYVEALLRVFLFVTTHPIVDYVYDEVDYVRNYEDRFFAFQYKVEKLKSFISDDYRALLNYVRAQNKTAIKYEFAVSSIDLESRYRTAREDGRPFNEPMYMFPIQKVEPDNSISARIFIDGLMCTTFALERYAFTDIFYIPADYISGDSYIEIEVFHYYEAKHVHTFTSMEPFIELEFPAKEFIRPTISDIYFYPGTEETLERIDKDKFRLEFVTDRYNYYVDENTPIVIYYKVCPQHGDTTKDVYYDAYGKCYSFEGQPMPENDITADDVSTMLSQGIMTEQVGYETDNHLTIVRLEDVVTFDRVAVGETTLQSEENKGLLYSDLTKVRITLLDLELYNTPITIAISKKPMFKGGKIYRVDFPQYSTPIPNYQDAQEYTRAFKNGRLMSKNRYAFTDYFDGVLGMQVLDNLERGDTMGFDITPFRNRLVYYKEELDGDTIDLRGYINKPFDPKFYEVYLNGRRLNRTNLFPISPWEIKLGGLHSIYNLEVYERDRDWEYYGINFSNYYTLSDLIREPFVDDLTKTRLIRHEIGVIPPNDNCEDRQPWDSMFDLYSVYFEIFYYMKLIPMRLATGSMEQFNTEDIAKRYPIIYDLYHVTNELGDDVLLLNPDIYYEPENEDDDPIGGKDSEDSDNEGVSWRVYLLGNTETDDLDPPMDPENDYWEGD